MKNAILSLLSTFINEKISAPEFEMKYVDYWRKLRDLRWQNSEVDFTDDELRILDHIFTAVDSYCSSSQLRGEHDLDENELMMEVTKAAGELRIVKS